MPDFQVWKHKKSLFLTSPSLSLTNMPWEPCALSCRESIASSSQYQKPNRVRNYGRSIGEKLQLFGESFLGWRLFRSFAAFLNFSGGDAPPVTMWFGQSLKFRGYSTILSVLHAIYRPNPAIPTRGPLATRKGGRVLKFQLVCYPALTTPFFLFFRRNLISSHVHF